MPDDPLLPPPASDPPIDPVPIVDPIRRRKLICEYCECTLAPTGEVLRRGDEARRLSRLDDALEKAKAELAQLSSDLAAAREELGVVKAATTRQGVRIPI